MDYNYYICCNNIFICLWLKGASGDVRRRDVGRGDVEPSID